MKRYWPEGCLWNEPQNRRALQDAAQLTAAMERQDVLEAVVTRCDAAHNLYVDLPCMTGIIPHDEGAVGIREGAVRDIALLSRVGKPVCFVVKRLDTAADGTPRAVLSRRDAQQQCRGHLFETATVGDVVQARVTRLEGFGAFCDIGCGVPALLPIANMSVSRISHPRDRVRVGDMLRCMIASMDDGRICLSMRELLGTWEENAARFCAGETVIGVVRSVEPYGVFVELSPNLAGLAEPKEGVCAGQTVSVFIKSILPDKMKVKLVIIDVGEAAVCGGVPTYFTDAAHIDRWCYAPPSCRRRAGTNAP